MVEFIFPTVWILGFGTGTAALWLGLFHGRANQPPPEWMCWQFLATWLLGSAFLIWNARRLRRVSLRDGILTVSNYFQEISIPLSAISHVTRSYLSNPVTIPIHLDQETPLGRRILFIPCGPADHFLSLLRPPTSRL